MPLYEYTCGKCERDFEILVRPGEGVACPECGSPQVQKQLSVPAAHVAGSRELPVGPPAGGCGLPQCGMGSCGM